MKEKAKKRLESRERQELKLQLPVGALLGFLLASIALLTLAPPVGAAVVTDRPLLFSFDGSDSTAGPFKRPFRIATDEANDLIYVSEGEVPEAVVSKFTLNGTAANFSATGTSTLFGSPEANFLNNLGLSVDNSGGANQGRLYVSQFGATKVTAFAPSGEWLWEIPESMLGFQAWDSAVDAGGHLWVAAFGSSIKEFANTGSPPSQIGSLSIPGGRTSIDLDASGNLYVADGQTVKRYSSGGVPQGTIDSSPGFISDIAVDQSSPTGHLFSVHGESFNEYSSTGTLLGTYGLGGALDSGSGVAYDPATDRVYVGDEGLHVVSVFGSPVTATVPDPAIEPATEVKVGSATFHGKINPQSVPNGYYFEWTRSSTGWTDVDRSPVETLPTDGVEHSVSYTSNALRGNSTYRVRLVAINTEKGLRMASSAVGLDTNKAPEAPQVTIDPVEMEATTPCPSGITTTGACISGTINPLEDSVGWRVQLTTDPTCSEGFADQALQTLPGEGRNVPVPVFFEATGLIPAQDYCVRIVAINSFGTTATETKQFTTSAVPAAEISTAFTAPRTDATARINARVNPEGAPFTYRFESSADGGETWEAGPALEDTSRAREQIVVGDELTGLEPETNYQYRLAEVENEAGPATFSPETKSFTTRSTAEVSSPSPCPNEAVRAAQRTSSFLGNCRAIELVNDPDKGGQNVRTEIVQGTSPLSIDGESAVWNVLAGAPGGNVGAGASFLAERAPGGWRSRSLLPPFGEQLGGSDEGRYLLAGTNPQLSAFVFNASVSALSTGSQSRSLVWVDRSQNQRLLKEYAEPMSGGNADVSDDGAHVLVVDRGGKAQLEDIGDGDPEAVSLMPDDLPNKCGLDSSDANRSFIGGTDTPGGANLLWRPGYHMISATDASRVYFQAKPNVGLCSQGLYGIYQRDRDAEETTLIDPGTSGVAPNFIRTTPDGRAAYFLTFSNHSTLASLDPAEEDQNTHADVYRWDEATGTATCLTCVVEDAEVAAVRQGVLVSHDFSHIYFQSRKQLVPGEGRAGELNVYALSDGEINFVANPDAASTLNQSNALLSADGSVLVFKSDRELTADRLAASCEHGPCSQLFLYDDDKTSLECVSCRYGSVTENSVGVFEATPEREFRLSGDGSTVAFTTAERLVAIDVNGSTDVYEWRNGVRSLLSDGVTTYPLSFTASPLVHAVSSDGRDILFSLVDPGRTGFEQDGFANLYDARIGGGFTPPSPPVRCFEDACQGPLQAPPSPAHPSSVGFAGRGNLTESARPCRRGLIRRGRRCVARQPVRCRQLRDAAKRRCVKKHSRRSGRKSGRSAG